MSGGNNIRARFDCCFISNILCQIVHKTIVCNEHFNVSDT